MAGGQEVYYMIKQYMAFIGHLMQRTVSTIIVLVLAQLGG